MVRLHLSAYFISQILTDFHGGGGLKYLSEFCFARFEVSTAVKIRVEVVSAVTSCSAVGTISFTLKMEAARSSETLVSYRNTTRRQSDGVRFPGNKYFSLHHNVQTEYATHPVSCPTGTACCFGRIKRRERGVLPRLPHATSQSDS
jgi:hypothetical protein